MVFSAKAEKIREIETGRRPTLMAFALIFLNQKVLRRKSCDERITIAFNWTRRKWEE